VLDQKHVKIISVKGRQIICLFKAPTYLGQTLDISSDKSHVADNYTFGEEFLHSVCTSVVSFGKEEKLKGAQF
jgi:hypothetical protein